MVNKKTCVLILARSGSKRLPGKNIKDFHGKPLIVWTIEAAMKTDRIDKVFCHTDDKMIASISINAGAEVPFIRPASVSEDATSSEETARNFLKQLQKQGGYYPDQVVLLQPTSPLRNAKHILEALNIFSSRKADLLISVRKNKSIFDNLRFIDDDKVNRIKDCLTDERYQHFKHNDLYSANGAIYIIKTDCLENGGGFGSDNAVPYIMSESDSVDIDTIEDFLMAECLFKNKQELK